MIWKKRMNLSFFCIYPSAMVGMLAGWEENDLWETHFARSVSPSPLPQVRWAILENYLFNKHEQIHLFSAIPPRFISLERDGYVLSPASTEEAGSKSTVDHAESNRTMEGSNSEDRRWKYHCGDKDLGKLHRVNMTKKKKCKYRCFHWLVCVGGPEPKINNSW